MILLQNFLYVCPFPSCEFWHLFFQKKKEALNTLHHYLMINLHLFALTANHNGGHWLGYGLHDQKIRIWFLAWAEFSIYRVQITSEVHPTSYPIGTGDSYPEDEAAGSWSRPPTSTPFIFKTWCLIKHRGKLYLYQSQLTSIIHFSRVKEWVTSLCFNVSWISYNLTQS
jgi:hypothetical protein